MKNILKLCLLTFGISAQVANAAWIQNPANGHYYDLISAPNDFWQAENIAESIYGAHLATIADANESQWLVDTFGAPPAWIGLTDEAQEGIWVWITGEPVTFTNWWTTEPNNNYFGQPENYAFMNYGEPGRWADVRSGDSRYPFYAYIETTAVPVPAAVWLFASGIIGLIGVARRKKS